jgi:dTDP-4-dehydrorhamnose reductase
MKKALIIGASGHLGNVFAKRMVKEYEVVATFCKNYSNPVSGTQQIPLDIMNYREVGDVFNSTRPNLVIHCAAMTNVDKCEDNPKLAWDTHEVGTENVSQWCRKANSKLVYISTDSVFDGARGNYKETDETTPINVYGASKLRGEKVAMWAKDYLIIRTAFFGHKGLAKWVMDNLKENKEIEMYRDVYFSPIFTEDLVDIILQMCEKNLQGIYHVGGRGSWSKYEFGVYLARAFNLNPFLIKRVLVKTVKERVPRPKNISINVSKVETDLGIKMPTFTEGLKHFKEGYERYENRVV